MANKIADAVLTFALMKRLVTPFEKWPAFKLGIIDEDGKVLKPQKTLTAIERQSWGRFDILAANIKKIINKIPGASTRLGSIATATFLFKEGIEIAVDERLEKKLIEHLQEDGMAANAVGGGYIAGVGIGPQGEPPMGRAAHLKMLRKVMKRKKSNVAN